MNEKRADIIAGGTGLRVDLGGLGEADAHAVGVLGGELGEELDHLVAFLDRTPEVLVAGLLKTRIIRPRLCFTAKARFYRARRLGPRWRTLPKDGACSPGECRRCRASYGEPWPWRSCCAPRRRLPGHAAADLHSKW